MAGFCSREDAAGRFPAVASQHVMMRMSRPSRGYGWCWRLMWRPCVVCVSPVTYGQPGAGVTSCGGARGILGQRADVTLLVDTYDTGGVQIAAGVPSTRPD
jgi:hypothetical protein